MAELPRNHPSRPALPVDPAADRVVVADPDDRVTIDCDDCRFQGTDVCADCVVTFLCDRAPDDAVVIDVTEVRAVRLLAAAGLVPTLRHRHVG